MGFSARKFLGTALARGRKAVEAGAGAGKRLRRDDRTTSSAPANAPATGRAAGTKTGGATPGTTRTEREAVAPLTATPTTRLNPPAKAKAKPTAKAKAKPKAKAKARAKPAAKRKPAAESEPTRRFAPSGGEAEPARRFAPSGGQPDGTDTDTPRSKPEPTERSTASQAAAESGPEVSDAAKS